jgi:hypothetical protein
VKRLLDLAELRVIVARPVNDRVDSRPILLAGSVERIVIGARARYEQHTERENCD